VELGGEGGSCTEGRGVVISMTGGVEGAERALGVGTDVFKYKWGETPKLTQSNRDYHQ